MPSYRHPYPTARSSTSIDLASLFDRDRFPLRTVVELGAGPPDFFQSWSLLDKCDTLILIDPIKANLDKHRNIFERNPNKHTDVIYHECAVVPEDWPGKFIQMRVNPVQGGFRAGQSFVDGGPVPPCVTSKAFHDAQTKWPLSEEKIPAIPLSELDPGDIDVLVLDLEGAEWWALSTMISRPEIILIELYENNQYIEEIRQWFFDNDYEIAGGVPVRREFLYRKVSD